MEETISIPLFDTKNISIGIVSAVKNIIKYNNSI